MPCIFLNYCWYRMYNKKTLQGSSCYSSDIFTRHYTSLVKKKSHIQSCLHFGVCSDVYQPRNDPSFFFFLPWKFCSWRQKNKLQMQRL